VISLSHRPLPDKTKHSQQTDNNGPTGIRTKNLSMRGPQTNALDRTATETGFYALYSLLST